MDDLNKFLESAGLSHLIERLLAEGLTFEVLLQANDAELSELTTKLADKIKLRSALEKIRQQNSSSILTNSVGSNSSVELFSPRSNISEPVSVALPERQSIFLLGPEETLEDTPLESIPLQTTQVQVNSVQTAPEQAPPVLAAPEQATLLEDYNTNQPGSSKDFSFSLAAGEEFDFFNDINTFSSITENGQSLLHNILQKHTRGKVLIEKAKKGQTLTSQDRGYIVSLIVEAELQLLQKLNQTIRKDIWQKWSNEVATLFKGESKDLYYVPYHVVGGKVIQASGLIHNRLITHRRSLTLDTIPKKRRGDSDSSDSGCSTISSDPYKRVRPFPYESQAISTQNSEEILDWLRGSSSPQDIPTTT